MGVCATVIDAVALPSVRSIGRTNLERLEADGGHEDDKHAHDNEDVAHLLHCGTQGLCQQLKARQLVDHGERAEHSEGAQQLDGGATLQPAPVGHALRQRRMATDGGVTACMVLAVDGSWYVAGSRYAWHRPREEG
jgi:hypothetical protein